MTESTTDKIEKAIDYCLEAYEDDNSIPKNHVRRMLKLIGTDCFILGVKLGQLSKNEK